MYPAHFYYTQKTLEVHYSHVPSGEISVDRLIKNQPYWKLPVTTSPKKNKTLILADWTMANWSIKKQQEVISNLISLMNDGFPIYLWQDGHFEQITGTNCAHLISDARTRDRVTPITANLLEKQAISQLSDVVKDQILILDDYQINGLLDSSVFTNSRELDCIEIINTKFPLNDLRSVLLNAAPPIKGLTDSFFSDENYEQIKKIEELIPEIPLVCNYDKASLTGVMVEELLEKNQIKIKGKIFSIKQLNFLKQITLKAISSQTLHKILPLLPNLNKIELKDSKELDLNFAEPILFPHLEKIKLTATVMTGRTLSRLLMQSPKIKTIFLNHGSAISGNFRIEKHLAALETIRLHRTVFSRENLRILISQSRIKRLAFANGTISNNFLPDTTEVPSLETLEIINCFCEAENLNQMLMKFRNLKSLTLIKSGLDITDMFFSLPLLDELKINLEVYNSWSHAFNKAPLQKLILVDDKGSTSFKPNSFNFSKLKYFGLNKNNLSITYLKKLLLTTTELTHLDLQECSNLKEITETLPLKSIEVLDLAHTDINDKALIILLQSAPKLKLLDLSGCNSLQINAEIERYLIAIKKVYLPNHIKIQKNKDPGQFAQIASDESVNLDKNSVIGGIEREYLSIPINRSGQHNNKTKLTNSNNNSNLSSDNPYSLSIQGDSEGQHFNDVDTSPSEELTKSNNNNVPGDNLDSSSRQGDSKNQNLDEKNWDADTLPSNNDYNVKRIFSPISSTAKTYAANSYRINIFNSLTIAEKCSINNPFVIRKSGDLQLATTEALFCSAEELENAKRLISGGEKDYYLGNHTLTLSNAWQSLPSLNSAEKLTHYSISPAADVEIRYSQRDNQYYIRSISSSDTVNIRYIIGVPNNLTKSIPPYIEEMISFCKNFAEKALEIDEENASGNDYLQAIIDQKVGSCRHRAIAFFYLMKKNYPEISVRIITNSCHVMVEFQLKGEDQWFDADLGGYTGTLNESMDMDSGKVDLAQLISTLSDLKGQLMASSIQDTRANSEITQENLENENEPAQDEQSDNQVDATTDIQTMLSNHLETWKKTEEKPLSVRQYCKKISQSNNDKKYLIDVSNQSTGYAFLLAIKNFCIHTHRRFYYINSPEDLACSGRYLKNQQGFGYLLQGPGGPLHDFLTDEENIHNPALLLINYQNFDADDLVRFNRIIDDERYADGTPLPENMILVGIINSTQPNSYQGEDFYSRFDKIETCPFSEHELSLTYPQFLKEDDNLSLAPSYDINLFNMPNWQDRLLGRWTINKDRFYFQAGELPKALEQNTTIRIQNGPWNDPSFEYFWKQAVVNGFMECSGKKILLPGNFKIIEHTGYDWESLLSHVNLEKDLSQTPYVLNPTLLTSFFSDYDLDQENRTLDNVPGVLEKNANRTLAVNLTRSLSEDEWAMILTECKRLNIKLTCHVMTGVSLPDCFQWKGTESHKPSNWERNFSGPLSIIHSTDCETTIAQICNKTHDWLVINVSELEASDLITRMDCVFNEKESRFEFYKTERILLEALKNNKKIILTGAFSNHFIDNLMPLILSRQTEKNPLGNLVIIYDSQDNLLPKTVFHEVTVAEKKEILSAIYDQKTLQILSDETFQEGLSRLKARIRFYLAHEDLNTDAAWSGLASLPPHRNLTQFNLSNSKDITVNFIKKRLEQIWRVLHHSPYIYLSGLTGVGKSTFVEQYIGLDPNVAYFQGEEQLKDWATDHSDKLKVIFIDEANIGSRKWSEFEGLFQNPSGVLIDGVFYPVTDRHKVIFAGNPVNYGNDRQIAPLFKNHGNALVFDAMPPEFIYETVLKPIFKGTEIEKWTQELSGIYLYLYNYIVNLSDKEVLISARELQMMALQTLAYHNQFPQEDIGAVAASYTYEIGRTLVPETKLKEFSQNFSVPPLARVVMQPANNQGNFIVTPSRQHITNQLNDLLYLRQYRQNYAMNEAQKFGGLGGIILEGEPGIGKSEIVINTLITHEFKEGSLDKISTEQNVFYRLLMSMQMDDKKALLLKAFNEGAVVIIDEINSSPMMERWLNDVLMGINPLTKQRPERPGFLIIGTQNPVTMAGRRRPGNALARRLITTVLSPYSKEEMISILIEKGIEPKLACIMVETYHEKRDEARLKNLNPMPTFRDLLRMVKNYNLALTKESMAILSKSNYPALSEFVLNNPFKPYILNILCKNASTPVFLFFNAHLDFFKRFVASNSSENKIVALIAFMQKLPGKFTAESIPEILITTESLSAEDLNVVINNFDTINDFCIKNNYKFHHFLSKSKIAKIEVLCNFIKNNEEQGALVINQLETPEGLAERLHQLESLKQGTPQRELFIRQSCKLTKTHLDVLAGLIAESNQYANSFQLLLDTMLHKAQGVTAYTELFKTLSLFEQLGADLSTLEGIRDELYQSSPYVLNLLNDYVQHEEKGTELLQEIQSSGLFSLNALNQYLGKHQKFIAQNNTNPTPLLSKIHRISSWLQQNGEANELWLKPLNKLWLSELTLLDKVLDLSLSKDKRVFLNALSSNILEYLLLYNEEPSSLVSHCESLHLGTAMKHFELSDSITFNEERTSLLKHLERKTFVTVNSPDPQSWTQEKNAAALDFIYSQYMTAFKTNVDEANTAHLLVIAEELNKANLPVSKVSNATIPNELKDALTKRISIYQNSFWIRKYRRENSNQLSDTIANSTNFGEILKALYTARDAVIYNDTHHEKNMHRRGRSRYYDALNEMEEILLEHWTQNPQSLAEFKAYHQVFKGSLAKSFTFYIKALNSATKGKNTEDKSVIFSEYSPEELETALSPNKSCPGYIHALAREVKDRMKAMKKFESLHESSVVKPN